VFRGGKGEIWVGTRRAGVVCGREKHGEACGDQCGEKESRVGVKMCGGARCGAQALSARAEQ